MAKPEITFKVGAARASIFRNTIKSYGKSISLPKVVLEVRYKDREGNWRGTNSLSINDIPKAMTALQKAYDYLLSSSRTPNDSRGQADQKDRADQDQENQKGRDGQARPDDKGGR